MIWRELEFSILGNLLKLTTTNSENDDATDKQIAFIKARMSLITINMYSFFLPL